jgi:predicted RNA-binding protein YlqC (UPF0109 family)
MSEFPSSSSSSDQSGQAPGTKELAALIESIAKMLVDHSDEVSVTEKVGENTTVIELRVTKTDIGKIIGKEGKTAKAIRTILLGASTKLKRRTVLEIIE